MARVNASSVPAASAGESIGSVTCQKARQALAPWTRATTASRVPLASRLRETAKYTTGKILKVITSTIPLRLNSRSFSCQPVSCCR